MTEQLIQLKNNIMGLTEQPEHTLLWIGVFFACVVVLAMSVKIIVNLIHYVQGKRISTTNQKLLQEINKFKLKNMKKKQNANEDLRQLFVENPNLPCLSGLGYEWLDYAQSKNELKDKEQDLTEFVEENQNTKQGKAEVRKQSLF